MRSISHLALFVIVCTLCLGGITLTAQAEEITAVSAKAPCCFETPRYSGTCEVTPGEEESCGSILGYLNNPNSIGKNYCGNTKVRGGWQQVDCESKEGVACSNTSLVLETPGMTKE